MTIDEAQHTFEKKLVRHCAPTLAGVKASNLFNCSALGEHVFLSKEHHRTIVDRAQSKMRKGGVVLSILVQRDSGALVFVYRPCALRTILQHGPSRLFLQERGYDTSSPEACIESLRRRFKEFDCRKMGNPGCARCDFPHEVGLLLGYPFEDVMGFIDNDGQGDKCTGTWKVYGNELRAKSAFSCYKHHTRRLSELFSQGASIGELAMLGQATQRHVS